MGAQLPSSKWGQSPQFSAHICCGEIARWIKMPLGMELGLGPGNFVLDRDPAPPPQKGAESPKFLAGSLWPYGWMDQDGCWHGGRPQPTRLCVRWGPSPLHKKGAELPLPIFGPFLLWPNGWMHQDATGYDSRPQPRGLCVAWGPSLPFPKRGWSPQFSGQICCGQMAAWINMPLGMEVGLGPDDIVLDGDPPPFFPKRGQSAPPQFPAHVCCGQTAWWIKMALGMQVGLGPGHIVLDGNPAPLPKNGAEPQFSVHFYFGQTAECIRMPLGMEVGLGLCDIVLDGDPATPRKKGTRTPTQFLAHVYCGKMAGWMKVPLGTEVNIGPGDIVLDGVVALPKRGTATSFRFMSIVAKRLDGWRRHLVRK